MTNCSSNIYKGDFMIYFFPMPYPDESMYNIFVRYNRLTGNNNYYLTVNELIGTRNAHVNFCFANNLDYLCNQFPEGSSFNSDYFLLNHTILPIYKSFVPEDRFERALNSFKNDNASTAISSIGYSSGLLFNIGGFSYCSDCIKEDQKKYGEAYIHRSHQIDGNFTCIKHHTILNVYLPKKSDFRTLYDINEIDLNSIKINDSVIYLRKLLNVSHDIDALLNLYNKMPDYSLTKRKYLSRLRDKGYFLDNGKINQLKLHHDFINHFEDNFLVYLKSYPDPQDINSWLKTITTNTSRTIHTLRSLLLINFLFNGIEDFINYPVRQIPYINNPSVEVYKANNDYNILKKYHKNKLLILLAQEPNLRRSQIYRKLKNTYVWLSKNEKEWFEDVLPKPYQRKDYIRSKINWEERDSAYYIKVNNAIHNILYNGILERITTHTISKLIDYKSLYKNLNKMPKTQALIKEHSETPIDFNKRKLQITINNLKSNDINITLPMVLRKAKIGYEYHHHYYDYINELLK